MWDMRPIYSAIRAPTKLTIAAAVALLLTSGTAGAQLGILTPSPALGVPNASTVGGTGIPMGATELGIGGLSPAPLGVTPSAPPVGPSMSNATMGMTGTAAPFGSGLSPSVSPPASFSLAPPTFGITNFGVGGLQSLPGSPRSGSAGTDH
jgi:hypothetical protein